MTAENITALLVVFLFLGTGVAPYECPGGRGRRRARGGERAVLLGRPAGVSTLVSALGRWLYS